MRGPVRRLSDSRNGPLPTRRKPTEIIAKSQDSHILNSVVCLMSAMSESVSEVFRPTRLDKLVFTLRQSKSREWHSVGGACALCTLIMLGVGSGKTHDARPAY
jgi:hypothetical protein